MVYEFGDILDARSYPSIGHFILVVGETKSKGKDPEVMYYAVTSRVYAVFKDILNYFNSCLSRKDPHFQRFFAKEKKKSNIMQKGPLCQAVFLDKHTNYDSCLDVDSMVVINREPELIDKKVLETLKSDGKVLYKTRLSPLDSINLMHSIKYSNDISTPRRMKISENFNKIKTLVAR